MSDIFLTLLLIIILILVIIILKNKSNTKGISGSMESVVDDFPYKTITDVKEKMKRLAVYKFNLQPYNYKIWNIPSLTWIEMCWLENGKPTLIVNDAKDYDLYNNLSDKYNERARMLAKRYDKDQSPMEYWNENRDTIRAQFKNQHDQREYIFSLYLETTSFRPTLLAGMIEKYKSKKVLDISAGWGDRLLAACAKGVEYFGVDPNPLTQDGYKAIIKEFGNGKQQVVMSPFEDAKIEGTFDLIFTSPPYFDLEIYNKNDPNQSVNRYKSQDAWFDKFLMFSLAKAWSHLDINGYMCIVINDVKGGAKSVVKEMIDRVNGWKDSEYQGLLSYAEFVDRKPKSPQPIWIWKKIKPIEPNPPLVIEELKPNFLVVRDDLLPGGTKQRCAVDFIKTIKENEVVYVGPEIGLAQAAIGVAAKLTGKIATFFTSIYGKQLTSASIKARKCGTRIIDVGPLPLKETRIKAEEYCKKNGAMQLPFGFDSPKTLEILSNNIKEAATDKRLSQIDNIWVAAGSGTLANALRKVFPLSTIHMVQVGKEIYQDMIPPNSVIHVAPYKFSEPTKILPPYPAIPEYDAKVYEIMEKHKGSGVNLIWTM